MNAPRPRLSPLWADLARVVADVERRLNAQIAAVQTRRDRPETCARPVVTGPAPEAR